MYVIVSAVIFAFFVFTLIDVIRSPSANFLPKMVWVFVVILIPLLGSILWWAVGRERGEPVTSSAFPERVVERTRPAPAAPARRVDTRTTEQQLADLEREEQEERLRAELARRRRERGLEEA